MAVSTARIDQKTPASKIKVGDIGYILRGNQDLSMDMRAAILEAVEAFSPHIGLIATWVSNTSFSIGPGVVGDDTHVEGIRLLTTTTKTTAAWASGDNVGGLFSGTIANSTWYYAFGIKNLSTGLTDWGFDISPTAPSLPTGWTVKRMLCAAYVDGSGHFRVWKMNEDGEQEWPTLTQDVSDTSLSTTRKSETTTAVPAISHDTKFNISLANASGGLVSVVGDSAMADVAPSGSGPVTSNFYPMAASLGGATRVSGFYMTGQTFYCRSTQASTSIQVSIISFNIRPYH
jgi:hypothetical protein